MKQAINIKESQRLYLDLLKRYQSTILSEQVSSFVIAKLLDDITCFWLDRMEVVELELEYISSNFDCFMLSGAIYLNIGAKRLFFKGNGPLSFYK